MAFKKSGNSRDDRSGNSSRRASGSGSGGPKKPFSSSRTNSTSSFGSKKSESDDDRPKRRPESGPSEEKKPYNKGSKTTGRRAGESFSADKKFKSKPGGDFKKRPYGTKDFSGTPTGSGFSSGSGFKKPYGSRDSSDRPEREGGFKKEGADSFKRKPYGSKDFSERPPRETGFKNEGGDSFKRKPYGSKDFSARPPREGGFNGPSSPEKPFRKRSTSDAPVPRPFHKDRIAKEKPKSVRESFFDEEQEPQGEKTMRGRKTAALAKDKGLIRLNRYISNAGICSRRKADELIVAGVVSVNGVVISELGHKVDPAKDEVRYNGEMLKREKMVYVLLNKPKDYITTTEDPQERRTVMHLVEKASKERIYPVGRLDRNTTGLLLMTNDGDLADKLSHPRTNVTKLYHVELDKSLTQGDLNKIGFGLELEDGPIKPDSVSYVTGGSKREVGIQIHSGKNRIVRRIFEHLGYEVMKLDRAVYANLTKKDLPRGRWRYLEEKEVIMLKHLIK